MVDKMLKNKENNIQETKLSKLRLVVARGEERRQKEHEDKGVFDQRVIARRQDDKGSEKNELNLLRQENERLQERQRKLIISRPELVLYYAALILSVNVIFGWMAYLALFI